MAKFGKTSKERMATCHPSLKILMEAVVEKYDCSILEGHRSDERQAELLSEGKTTLGPGKSKHNRVPSLAVDVVPYPVDWNDRERFYHFAGYVRGMAEMLGIKLRWGGDWSNDFVFTDQTFDDLPHFEIMEA